MSMTGMPIDGHRSSLLTADRQAAVQQGSAGHHGNGSAQDCGISSMEIQYGDTTVLC